MNIIDQVFDRMDAWRHLPNYQLERRADLFFSLYLAQVLAHKTGQEVNDLIVPEFPVRIGSIYPDIVSDKSYKIDYLALSQDRKTAFFVELKTDGASRRLDQDKYLLAARQTGLNDLLHGILRIFRASKAKRKYYHLLVVLEALGLLEIPIAFKELMSKSSLRGANEASQDIRVISSVQSSKILYIQPLGEGPQIINFAEFSACINENNDLFAARFAHSLSEWAGTQAGLKAI